MPASLRTHGSRARPYDRRSPTASPARSHHSAASAPTSPAPATQDEDQEDDEPDVPQDHPGLPTYAEYKRIEAGYLDSLSPRKRDKALITQTMFDKIWDVLHHPDACSIATPQFRFWVRKMFTLSRPMRGEGEESLGWGEGGSAEQCDSDTEADRELERSMGIGRHRTNADEADYSAVVLHENRPVAIMEQLYELFCYCHVRSGHGGRDKTCAVIREHYSWVPKELTAQFVKACPTCISKRNGHAHRSVDMGGLAHKRVRRGKRGRRVEVGAEPVVVKPSCPGLPTTGGPLDPPSPELLHERERECGQDLLCARGNKGAVGSSNSASPARSRTQSTPPLENCLVNGWSSVPRALTLNVSPLRTCNTVQLGNPFALNNNPPRPSDRKEDEKENCNPRTRTTLPSLATALSDDSLDDKVNLTELGHGPTSATKDGGEDSECVLPPVLRPLRLMGPASGSSSDLQAFSASASPGTSATSPFPLQIDPVLLSFSYPGMALSSAESDAQGSGIDGPGVHLDLGVAYAPCLVRASPGAIYQPVSVLEDSGEGLESTRVPFDRWQDHNVRFGERPASYVHVPTIASASIDGATTGIAGPGYLPMESLSTDLGYMMPVARRRYGSRYGYRDGPFNAMLYPLHCSADEVGQQLEALERPLSFSIAS